MQMDCVENAKSENKQHKNLIEAAQSQQSYARTTLVGQQGLTH